MCVALRLNEQLIKVSYVDDSAVRDTKNLIEKEKISDIWRTYPGFGLWSRFKEALRKLNQFVSLMKKIGSSYVICCRPQSVQKRINNMTMCTILNKKYGFFCETMVKWRFAYITMLLFKTFRYTLVIMLMSWLFVVIFLFMYRGEVNQSCVTRKTVADFQAVIGNYIVFFISSSASVFLYPLLLLGLSWLRTLSLQPPSKYVQ